MALEAADLATLRGAELTRAVRDAASFHDRTEGGRLRRVRQPRISKQRPRLPVCTTRTGDEAEVIRRRCRVRQARLLTVEARPEGRTRGPRGGARRLTAPMPRQQAARWA